MSMVSTVARHEARSVELLVLGPPELRLDGTTITIRAAKVRAFAAALMLRRGRAASVGSLLTDLWPVDPPPSAVANLRTYAAQLRKVLPSGRLVTEACGYRLVHDDEELDLVRSRRLVTAAQQALAEGLAGTAARLLDRAQALWRGTPLDGIPLGPGLEVTREALLDEHRGLTELWIRSALAVGDEQVVARARAHAAADPLRESAQALLMEVQWATGDSAGALRTFAAARSRFVEELGIEPGATLRRLHEDVLRGTPAPTARLREVGALPSGAVPPRPRPAAAVAGPQTVGESRCEVPHELPSRPAALVGRETELARLTGLLRGAAREPVVVAVHGAAGAGSSVLVVAASWEVRREFPDGEVYVDAAARPDEPDHAVVDRVYRSLRPGSEPAGCADEAAARLRSLLHGRRVLVVVDNLEGSPDLRALLPTRPGAALVVTSRTMLAGLESAVHLGVGRLAPEDAIALLERSAGRPFCPVERERAREVAMRCDHLPYALQVAGARLAARPDLTLAGLADRLADESRRLDVLTFGARAVRARYQGVYDRLERSPHGRSAARLYRALGGVSETVTPDELARLLPDDGARLHDGLDLLVDLRVLDPAGEGLYRVHPLVRLHAREVRTTVVAGT